MHADSGTDARAAQPARRSVRRLENRALLTTGDCTHNGTDFRTRRPAMPQDGTPANDNPEWVVRTVLFVDLVESVRLMESNESDAVRRWRQFVATVQRDILLPYRPSGQKHGRRADARIPQRPAGDQGRPSQSSRLQGGQRRHASRPPDAAPDGCPRRPPDRRRARHLWPWRQPRGAADHARGPRGNRRLGRRSGPIDPRAGRRHRGSRRVLRQARQ